VSALSTGTASDLTLTSVSLSSPVREEVLQAGLERGVVEAAESGVDGLV